MRSGWVKVCQDPPAQPLREERAGLHGLQVGAAWVGGGACLGASSLRGTCVWGSLRPRSSPPAGGEGGQGAVPCGYKGPWASTVRLGSPGRPLAPLSPLSSRLKLPRPLRFHSTLSSLGYSGCGGRWRLRQVPRLRRLGPNALRRR